MECSSANGKTKTISLDARALYSDGSGSFQSALQVESRASECFFHDMVRHGGNLPLANEAVLKPAELSRLVPRRVPAIIANAGERASFRFIEFFTANIRNQNTRASYTRALRAFCNWCEDRAIRLEGLNPVIIAGYVEQLDRERGYSKPSVKQHLAAIKMLLDFLVTGGVLPMNPASSVRGPKYSIRRGKTPVLTAEEARTLLDSIISKDKDGNLIERLIDLRDRALIAVMVYTFVRVSAAVSMRVEDYFQAGKRWKFRFMEKGGKYNEVFAHHNAEAYVDAYLEAASIWDEKKAPLFR